MLGDNTKLLFMRGETFQTTAPISAVYTNVAIGAYGTGSSPLLQWTGPLGMGIMLISTSSYTTQNLSVDNLAFDSVPQSDTQLPDAIAGGGHNLMIRNCTFLNVFSCVNANGNPTGLLVQDNNAPLDTGVRACLVWLQGSDSTIIGNSMANSTRQHDIRASEQYTRTLIAYNTLDNKDRRPLGDQYDFSKSNINLQWGSYAYVANNTFYDGDVRVGPLGGVDEMNNNPTGYMNEHTNWVVVENNSIVNSNVEFHYGTQDAVARNNVIQFDGAIDDFNIDAYDSTYNQEVVNVSILNNTGINNSTQGNFIDLYGPASGLVMNNNLFVAPNLHTGPYGAGPVALAGTDTSSFSQISHNVWQIPAAIDQWTNGGVNIVNGNYVSAAQWDSLPNVSGDLFANVPISANFSPASSSAAAASGMWLPGVFTDKLGKARPAGGAWTVGAMQL